MPDDRQIDGMDMTDFLLGDAEESGRDIVLCLQGNRLQAAKWHQWKVHLFKQDDFYSTWSPLNMPIIYNLEWDPREEHQVDFPHRLGAAPGRRRGRRVPEVAGGRAADQAGHTRPVRAARARRAGRRRRTCRSAPIMQYVTTLVSSHDEPPDPDHGIAHQSG